MKGKISSIWRIATAMVMALSLGLVMAAPVAATVSSVSVVPADRTAGAVSKYTITLKNAVELVGGTDTISIEFPTGFAPAASIDAVDDVKINAQNLGGTDATHYSKVGQRVTLLVPQTVAVTTTFDVVIGNNNDTQRVTNHATRGSSYQLTVYTSKETTPVLSTAFIIGGSADSKLGVGSVALSPYTVGVASQYTITMTTEGTTLAANVGTITITFPSGTTVPASISSAAYVTIGGTALDFTTDYSANVSSRVVTLTVPADRAAAQFDVVFLVGAGIINPTTVSQPSLTGYTSQEPIVSATQQYAATLVAGAITKAVFTDLPVAAAYNTETTITLQTQDQYNNPKATTGVITFVLTTSNTATGIFDTATEVLTDDASSGTFTYKDTVSGATITAYESPSLGWTDATGTFTLNPQVALYHGTTLVANYTTIQAAITAAIPGDTIKVGAGTYTENLNVTKHHLTLESTAGKATTFIQGGMTLSADADYFVLGGASGKGFTLKGAAKVISLTNPENVTISYNKLDTTGSSVSNGIFIETAGATASLTVTENEFIVTDQYDMGIRSPWDGVSVVGLTVTNNTFTGTSNTLETSAIEILKMDIRATASTISGNTFTSVGNGIVIGSDRANTGLLSDTEPASLTISGNTFSGSKYGIDLVNASGTGVNQNIIIKTNTFSSNTYGLAIDYGSFPAGTDNWEPGDFTVKYNDFSGNTYAVYNFADSSANMIGEYNWWGSASGPSITATNPSGQGNAVSSKVDYSPWLYNAQATVTASGKSQYATSVLLSKIATLSGSTYSGGWNTFSTPIYLDGSADTWGEILTSANATAQVVIAYGWDGTNWTTIGTSTSITPLNAIFVQLKTAQSLPILYSTQLFVAPTKSMHATAGSYTGWELVGQAKLTPETQTLTLASISGKYSQVIDPISGAVIDTDGSMSVGIGYWVFMTGDSTLAGFSVTPVTWVTP